MVAISIVILTKNEANNIARCLDSVNGLSDDILVIDNGSTDATVEIAKSHGAHVHQVKWEGYAATKNKGNTFSKYDWILSLDADEELDKIMYDEIQSKFSKPIAHNTVFQLQRKMIYCGKILRYGSVAKEFRLRLFNKLVGQWNDNIVHEDLKFSELVQTKTLNGYLFHHSYQSQLEHIERLKKYAQLSANQMSQLGKKSNFVKLNLSPLFNFIKNYIFRLGFLDGSLGFQFSMNEMGYVKQKYQFLKRLESK